jgi:hypothetical protein
LGLAVLKHAGFIEILTGFGKGVVTLWIDASIALLAVLLLMSRRDLKYEMMH